MYRDFEKIFKDYKGWCTRLFLVADPSRESV